MKQRHVIITVLVLLLCAGILYADSYGGEQGDQLSAVDAASKAIQIMGCEGVVDTTDPKIGSLAKLVTIVDTTIPFISEQLNDREAYMVEMKDITVGPEKYKRSRDFEVYLDPETGQLLKIVSTLPSYYEKVKEGRIRKASVSKIEEQASRRVYLGFPQFTPKPAFLDALDVVPSSHRADQIVAVFVEFDRGSFGCFPAWVIETWGGYETILSGPAVLEEYQRNYLKTVIDTSGNLVFGTN